MRLFLLLYAAALFVVVLVLVEMPSPRAHLLLGLGGSQSSSSNCPATAPVEARQAGFTTMALCNDFTQPIPNSAGTGLPTHWLSPMNSGNPCAWSDPQAAQAVWFQGDIWFGGGCAPPYNEVGAGVQQVQDPNGVDGLTLQVGYSLDDEQSVGYQSITTEPNVGSPFHDYPQASFIQWVWRDNSESETSGKPNVDIWNWSHAVPGSTGELEYDLFEDWGLNQGGAIPGPGGAIIHNWFAGNAGSAGWGCGVFNGYHDPGTGPVCALGTPQGPNNVIPFTFSVYHTVGILITSDGVSNIWVCGYIDHVLMVPTGCVQPSGALSPNPGPGGIQQRNIPTITVGTGGSSITGCTAKGQVPNCLSVGLVAWVKSVQIWSCSDWNNPAGNYLCAYPNLTHVANVTNPNRAGVTGDLFYFHP